MSERTAKRNKTYSGHLSPNYKHGGRKQHGSTYSVWAGLIWRTKPNVWKHPSYDGVSVDDRWKTFTGFLGDMGERPSLRHSLSRYLDSGDYEPGNVEWAVFADQMAERRGKSAMQRLHVYNLEQRAARLEAENDALLKRLATSETFAEVW